MGSFEDAKRAIDKLSSALRLAFEGMRLPEASISRRCDLIEIQVISDMLFGRRAGSNFF
jgi:hypothetical protein